MQLQLDGLWQLSPLSDLSIPQNDLILPAPLSGALPESLSEQAIAGQEWHLMHDIEISPMQLNVPVVELVIGGIDYFAEVRINGEAVIDCDGSQLSYRKEIKRYLREGRNRVEILFLELEQEDLLGEPASCALGETNLQPRDKRMGIWQLPYLEFISYVGLDYITTEQIWHPQGGCELKVDLFYRVYAPGMVSASVAFNGMRLQIPLDIRSDQCCALFQVDAPRIGDSDTAGYYLLEVELGGQRRTLQVALHPQRCASHYPV